MVDINRIVIAQNEDVLHNYGKARDSVRVDGVARYQQERDVGKNKDRTKTKVKPFSGLRESERIEALNFWHRVSGLCLLFLLEVRFVCSSSGNEI